MIKIVAVGDIMPGGVLSGVNSMYMSDSIMEILQSGDIRVGTLETAIGNDPTFNEEKMIRAKDVIHTLDADLTKLKHLGVDLVSLANNHFFDLGVNGATHAIDLLDSMGIKHVGAGRNLAEASRPEVMDVNNMRIAFLAFCECDVDRIGWCPIATDDAAGVNPLQLDHVITEIVECKGKFDYVVVIPHWGKEGQIAPTDHQYKIVQKMVDAGADLILGSHTHCVQPILQTKGATVVFSMGNFLFPDRLVAPPRSTYYPKEPIDWNSLPVVDRYCFVEAPTLKKWRTKARYGLLAEACVEKGKTMVSGHIVHLTDDNRLELYEGRYPFASQLKLCGLALNSRFYPRIYLLQEYMNRIKRMVRKWIK